MAKNGILAHREYRISVRESLYYRASLDRLDAALYGVVAAPVLGNSGMIEGAVLMRLDFCVIGEPVNASQRSPKDMQWDPL
jgi:hypothetical protein